MPPAKPQRLHHLKLDATRQTSAIRGAAAFAGSALTVAAVVTMSGYLVFLATTGSSSAEASYHSPAEAKAPAGQRLLEQLRDVQRQLGELSIPEVIGMKEQNSSAALRTPGAPEAADAIQEPQQPKQPEAAALEPQELPEPGATDAATEAPQRAAADPSPGSLAPQGAGTRTGKLFTWGLGGSRSGRSGDNTIPAEALRGREVSAVSGSAHTLVVVPGGAVWTMGRNDSQGGGGHGSPPIPDSGQLGREGGEEAAPVSALSGTEVVQVAAGRYHSVALAADGRVFTWGLNDVGQLGRPGTTRNGNVWDGCVSGHRCRSGWPTAVKGVLDGLRITAISAGRYWTLAASEDGRLFTWGMDGCASGSLPPLDQRHIPREVGGALSGLRVVAMDSGYILWLARTHDGQVYSCDTQDDGYAGTLPNQHPPNHAGELGRSLSSPGEGLLPGKVELPEGEAAVSVAAGREHGLVATSRGRLLTWGHGGALMGRDGPRELPAPVDVFGPNGGLTARLVAAGEYFSLVATEDAVYGFGGNGYHMGGVGPSTADIQRPTKVHGPLGSGQMSIIDLQAGYQHVMAIVRPKGIVTARPMEQLLGAPTRPPAAPIPAEATHLAASPDPPQVAAHRRSWHPARARPVHRKADHVSYLWHQAKPPSQPVAAAWTQWRWTERHKAIVGTSPDVFQALPSSFDPSFKNPCWIQAGKTRCIPYFHVLGVSKCGTTDLYHRLAKHPEMKESTNKGPHFWDECPWPPTGACTVPPTGDFEGYIGLFDRAAAEISAARSAITGEASSNTFTASHVYLRGHDPSRNNPEGVTIAELLREAQPYLRLIIIFRNPVDRYFSAFNYYRDRRQPAPSAQDFHNRAQEEVRQWNACVQGRGVRECVKGFSPQQLVKGMYVEFLQDWLEHFPREQLLFLRSEDYAAATNEHMAAIFRFLGMQQPSAPEMGSILSMHKRNQQSKDSMLPETRRFLEEFYAPFNARLAAAMRDQRFAWQDP